MSVASFVACVRSGKVPTRSELLDAADALDAGCEVWCSCGDGIVADTGAMCGACIQSRPTITEAGADALAQLSAAKREAERFALLADELQGRLSRVLHVANGGE